MDARRDSGRNLSAFDGALSSLGLGGMSRVARGAVTVVSVLYVCASTYFYVEDLVSSTPSSTGILVFLFFGVYAVGAIFVIAAIDWTIRAVRRRLR